MKSIWTLMLLLFTSASSFGQDKTIVLETKNAENFKAWINGEAVTDKYVMYAEKVVKSGTTFSLVVEIEGVTEKIKKTLNFPPEAAKMRWFIKQDKKGEWDIKMDILYADAGVASAPNNNDDTEDNEDENDEGGDEGSEEPGDKKSTGSKAKAKIKFESLFLDLGTHEQNEVFNYEINIKNEGEAPLMILDVLASEHWITIVEFPKEAVAVGHYGIIKLCIVAPEGGDEHQVEKITIQSNTFMGSDNVNIDFYMTTKVRAKGNGCKMDPPPPPPTEAPACRDEIILNTPGEDFEYQKGVTILEVSKTDLKYYECSSNSIKYISKMDILGVYLPNGWVMHFDFGGTDGHKKLGLELIMSDAQVNELRSRK